MNEMQELQKMSPEELQELIEIYRAKKGGTMRAGQLHKPVLVNPYEEQLLGSLPNVSGQVDPMTGLRSFDAGTPGHTHTEDTEMGDDDDSGDYDWGTDETGITSTETQTLLSQIEEAKGDGNKKDVSQGGSYYNGINYGSHSAALQAKASSEDDGGDLITYSVADLDGTKHSSVESLTAKNQEISTKRTNTNLDSEIKTGMIDATADFDSWWKGQNKNQKYWGNFTESQVKSLFDKKVAKLAEKTTDQYGKIWKTEAEKAASNTNIDTGKTNLAEWIKDSGLINADDTYESATNRGVWDELDDPYDEFKYNHVSEEDRKTIFLQTLGQMAELSKPQINDFVDKVSSFLQGLSQTELGQLGIDEILVMASEDPAYDPEELEHQKLQLFALYEAGEIGGEEYRKKLNELKPPETKTYLSENVRRGLAEKALDLAIREARFTLTPDEVAQWSTEAPTVDESKVQWGVAPVIATATNFQEWWDSKGGPGTPEAPGTYPDETSARTAWEAAQVGQDVFAPTVAPVDFEEWWKVRGGEKGQYPDRATAEAQWKKEQVTDVTKTTISEIKAPTAATVGTVDEITETKITKPDDIKAPTVERVKAIPRTKIADFGFIQGTDVVLYDTSEIDVLRSKEGDFYKILKETIEGKRDSQAQQMLRAETERMMRLMLGTVAGADADPRKLRGIQNLWSDQQQNMIKESTQLRSKEEQEAQARMLQLFEISGTREAKLALADMEARRLTAIEQGNLDQARKIKDAEIRLQEVIVNATLDMKAREANLNAELQTAIANGNIEAARKISNQKTKLDIALGNAELEQGATLAKFNADLLTAIENGQLEQAAKIFNAEVALRKQMKNADLELAVQLKKLEEETKKAIANGQLELATVLGNLQGSLLIATTNPELAIKSRAMDNALAMASYEGQMQMAGVDVKIDENALDRELKTYLSDSAISADLEGIALKLETQMTIAEMQNTIALMEIDVKRDYNQILKLAEKNKANKSLYSSLLNAVATGIAAYASFPGSDIRMKKNVSSGDPEIERFLDALNAYQYEYRDPKAAHAEEGMFLGIMAQDAERGGPMGQSFVVDTPEGKKLDPGHGMAAILAAQANLHERTKKLEGGV